MRSVLFSAFLLCVPLAAASAQTVIDFEGSPTGPTTGTDYLGLGVRFGGTLGVQEFNYAGGFTEIVTSGDWYTPLEIVFVDPNDATVNATTSMVSMQNHWARDQWTASSYDLSGNLLETQNLNGVGFIVLTVGDIHRVVLDDVNSTAFAMDNLTFPRPTSNAGTTCFGDGSGAPCGCLNEAPPGSATGCLNGLGVGAALTASGSADTANDSFVLTANGVTNQPGLFFQGDNSIGGGAGITFGDGLRCCGQNVVRLEVVDPPGATQPTSISTTVTISTTGPPGTVNPGDTQCYQYWYRNPGTSPCGNNFNLSNSVLVTWL